MSIMRFLRGAPIVRPAQGGSLLLPRRLADQMSAEAWPKCARCMAPVSAYGVDNETPHTIEVWVRCDGVQPDGLAPRVHPSRRAGFTIDKRAFAAGWTPNTLVDVLRRLALEPGANGRWRLRVNHPDVVEPS